MNSSLINSVWLGCQHFCSYERSMLSHWWQKGVLQANFDKRQIHRLVVFAEIRPLSKQRWHNSSSVYKLSYFTTMFSALWSMSSLPLMLVRTTCVLWHIYNCCVLGSFKIRDFGDKKESLHNTPAAVPSGNTNHAFTLWPLLNFGSARVKRSLDHVGSWYCIAYSIFSCAHAHKD